MKNLCDIREFVEEKRPPQSLSEIYQIFEEIVGRHLKKENNRKPLKKKLNIRGRNFVKFSRKF